MSARNRLPGPYELLELQDGESVDLRVRSWQRGTMIIHPKYPGAPAEKEIEVLRVHMQEGSKQYPPMYYDITSKTLNAQLLPFLLEPGFEAWSFRVTKHGIGVRARFTLQRGAP